MSNEQQSSRQLEREADSARIKLGATLDQLRDHLVPANLFDEFAESTGLKNVSAEKIATFAVRQHPVPTMMLAAGLGIVAYAAAKRGHGHKNHLDLHASGKADAPETTISGKVSEALGSLAETATGVFRDRAQAKGAEFMKMAESQVSAAAEHLSQAVERKLDDFVPHVPGAPAIRPLLVSAIQVLLVAALTKLRPS